MSFSDLYYNGILGTLMQKGGFSAGAFSALYIGGYIFCMVAGYLLGSVNSAIIISKLKYGTDIRKSGSGNAGMTNVLRTYGKAPAALTFGGDALKTFLAFVAGTLVFGRCGAYYSCFMCVLGHIFPIYYRFKGGKGIVCAGIGILLLNPFAFAVILLVFIIVLLGYKYVSLASIMAAMIYPIAHGWSGQAKIWPPSSIFAVLTAVLVLWRHYPNMKRLLDRTEPKISIGKGKKKSAEDAAVQPDEKKSKKKSLHNDDDDTDDDSTEMNENAKEVEKIASADAKNDTDAEHGESEK